MGPSLPAGWGKVIGDRCRVVAKVEGGGRGEGGGVEVVV